MNMEQRQSAIELLDRAAPLPWAVSQDISAGSVFAADQSQVAVADVDGDMPEVDADQLAAIIAVAVNEWAERVRLIVAETYIEANSSIGSCILGRASKAPDAHGKVQPGCDDMAASARPEWREKLIQHIDAIAELPVFPSKYPSAKQLAAFVAGLKAGEPRIAQGGFANATPFLGLEEAKSYQQAKATSCLDGRRAPQTQSAAMTAQDRS